MAGFEVTLYGRIWVTPEEVEGRKSAFCMQFLDRDGVMIQRTSLGVWGIASILCDGLSALFKCKRQRKPSVPKMNLVMK